MNRNNDSAEYVILTITADITTLQVDAIVNAARMPHYLEEVA